MQEATVTKIATEALKPASGLIDALLGPKVNRIKKWAEQLDLKSRSDSTAVNDLLHGYMRRLLRRICGIQTVIFPQRVLPLTSVYEPLSLSERYGQGRQQRFDLTTEMLEEGGRTFAIVDSAGMGKSTFAKHFALEVLNSPQQIPIFFELRRVTDTASLLETLAVEIDDAKGEIDDKLLSVLLDAGGFVIILDGYDEVPEQLRNTVAQEITELALRFQNNSLILTARPEVPLPELPDSQLLIINPLTREQAESLVLRKVFKCTRKGRV